VKTFDVEDIEQAAAESEQDRRDHRALKDTLNELLAHDDAMRVPLAVRQLIEQGVDAVVVAKTLLIGNRAGGVMYSISARSQALHLDEHQAELAIGFAIRDTAAAPTATMLVSGAVWLATQFNIDRTLLRDLVQHAARRERKADRVGCGVVDIVDHEGIANRAWLLDAINNAQLPSFAPLEYKPE
jgi:hypothetical protein